MSILQTIDLKKYYGTEPNITRALDGVNFSVEDGEFVAVVGTSGSGKSTLLHMMGGLDTPTSGNVIVRDKELSKMNDEQLTIFRRRNIGFIFQNYNLVPILNVYENIVLPVELDGDTVDQKFLDEIVHLLGLEDKLKNMPNNLSGGQQQRVAIARALITKPAIVLADEPTGNLDSKTSAEVLGLIKRTSAEFRQTVVMITHNNDIARLADRIVRIEDGKDCGVRRWQAMTWPFENDTSGIVKRISNRSISANRKRNIFIVLTIALASALLSAIVLYGFGVMQETQNRNQKTAQIMYHAISEQQGQELYKQEEIAWVGEFFNAFSEQVNHSTVNFTYANADMLKSQSMPYSGDLPASENEIVVQESFLDSLGYSNELGQTIQIPFSDGTTHDFKLTGILDVKTGDIGRYTAIISKELVRQQYGDEGMIDYYIGLKGAQNMSEEEATNYANTLAQQLKISDDNVIVRSTYFNLKDENHGSDMLFYFLIGFVTFIGSGIVIYSIFYISVASSIRNYGQLRTIGTTKRQIKKMVYREGKLLAAIAIPIGLVIGNVIGYFLVPAGWYWLTTLCVTAGVGLFAFIIVMIAIHTPVKRAAAVSPLEALRYSDYQGKMKESSVLHRKITPASLAKMNLSRQKAKSTLTILSLSLGGVLVVLISTMLVSYDGVAEARGRAFPVGEFNIQLNANQSWDTAGISLSGLQQKNFLNADFVNAVESIDGVTGIKRWYYTDAEYRVNGNSGKWIQGFCRDEQQNLEKERIAGTTDYDELVAGNGIVLLQERADLYDIEAALGDTVEVDYKTESGQIRTKTYTVMGIVNEYSYSGFSKCFALPEQFMNEATGIDCTGTISVITDMEKFDTVEAALNQLIDGNSDLVMETIKESITYYSGLQQLSFGVLLIVAVIVVCFSLINLVNTTITNFLSRRQEIGMLQAIGLSKKQLIKMLCYEGLMYSVFATLVTLVLGTGLGFLSVQVVVKTMNPYFYYSFPWLIVLIYLAILLIVQFTLISYTTGNLKKQSLVEQIRTME